MSQPAADFASVLDAGLDEPFASFPVNGEVLAGDAGTFACHTRAVFPAGTLDVFDVALGYVAVLRDHAPVRWARDGRIVSDTASGAILSAEAHAEIQTIEDEFFMADQVDEAELPALVTTPSGAPVAVFSLQDDGTYGVAIGYEASGAACALIVYVPAATTCG